MAAREMFESRVLYGQGKRAVTLLTEDGCVFPIIAHEAKRDRGEHIAKQQSDRISRGERPMHQSTLSLAKAPWQPDFTTTNMQFHGGSKSLEPELPPKKSRSMHRSQIEFGRYGGYGSYPGYPGHESEDPNVWKTDYKQTYYPKDIIPANRLHLTSLVNRIDQTEGHKAKEAVRPGQEPMSAFTQYRRVHDKLGLLRGPGVEREHPVREQYNILTGETVGPAWKTENQRVSGNRVLHNIRGAMKPSPIQ